MAPDGKTIALNTKPKEATVYDITLMDWATRKMTPLTHESTPNHLWQSVAWSPDGKTLYANRLEVSFTDADIYAIDVASGKATNLTAHQGHVLNIASSLSKDGKTLLDYFHERAAGKMSRSWTSREKACVGHGHKWEASSGDFSPDGKRLTFTVNADGRVDAYMAEVATMRSEKIPVAGGVNGFAAYPNSFSPSGERLLLSHESSVEPGDFWVYDVSSRKSRQLTYSAIASLNSRHDRSRRSSATNHSMEKRSARCYGFPST